MGCVVTFEINSLNVIKVIEKSPDIRIIDDEVNEDPGILVVQGLISRILGPQFIPYFNLVLINTTTGQQYFEVSSDTSGRTTTITIKADTPVNLASGINFYLKYYGQCSFTWTGDQCNLTASNLPVVNNPVSIDMLSQYRYYMNVCTFGYSTVWWDWPRWEREIDWMALNGYNLPLAFVGQEYVWYQVFANLGLSESEIQAWFTGPAFLPWNRMGNVNEWAGNLTLGWMADQRDLQIQILTRMRQFGMQAVLPGFAGHVPEALETHYPKANITQLGGWGTFSGTYYLNPDDPLFSKIAQAFVITQNQLYGTDHFYNFDPFNELEPPSSDLTYLKNCSQSMFNNLIAADPQGIWVLQGWFLVDDPEFWLPPQTEAFLSGVPIGKMIVLDLWSDVIPAWNSTNYYYGHNWIWCMLHNFGGRSGMYGKIPFISTNPIEARSLSPNMVGTGLTPEAIEQNVIVYDLMSEMAWRSTPPDLKEWVDQYVTRRYGKHGLPFLSINDTSITNTSTFSFDLTEITTQALINLFMTNELQLNSAFLNNSLEEFNKYSEALLSIIQDVYTIASTQEMLLVGHWTARARALTPANESTNLYEMNARNQITLWGPTYSDVHDYAYKLWGGLTEDFYLARWTLFVKELQYSLTSSQPFNSTLFQTNCEAVEEVWNLQTYPYPTIPTGNSYEISKSLRENQYNN
ncbi:alpha-N-acetylglucosaminidase [Heterostelium album PN500]|uniref:Alpha-N-acetylglucosaminidase n=1 Tax=Heterostelium pallidum (strain ATCC 26659 / Pp 5 / PN500) TaxID=670386 RepID=D3BUP7_HETP5|nr:alpha-N-acetylglucosaminidase [Heterostelium album PN500]EFA74835.1 alpha-N-acetylglucosaminidase [Heterostelium album PN500]|eukprot:XP_020426969.1 alpha-N-acetylglucosaminidase [Heterostelium album PN500]